MAALDDVGSNDGRATMATPRLTGAGAAEAHACLGTRERRERASAAGASHVVLEGKPIY